MTTPLYSERLSFKILTKQDVSDQYIGWLNNPEINRYLETRFNQQNKETCELFVTTILNDPASYLFGIFDKKTCSHIGNIKLGFINSHHNTAQLSLFIGEKECWGKGYATEAIKCITQWGFNILGLKRIEAGCYEANMGSLRAFLKVGYIVEGFKRSCVDSDGQRVGCFCLGIIESDCFR